MVNRNSSFNIFVCLTSIHYWDVVRLTLDKRVQRNFGRSAACSDRIMSSSSRKLLATALFPPLLAQQPKLYRSVGPLSSISMLVQACTTCSLAGGGPVSQAKRESRPFYPSAGFYSTFRLVANSLSTSLITPPMWCWFFYPSGCKLNIGSSPEIPWVSSFEERTLYFKPPLKTIRVKICIYLKLDVM